MNLAEQWAPGYQTLRNRGPAWGNSLSSARNGSWPEGEGDAATVVCPDHAPRPLGVCLPGHQVAGASPRRLSGGLLPFLSSDRREQWRYEPLLLNGQLTEFILTVTVAFDLSRAGN